jgi:hypothetical protein
MRSFADFPIVLNTLRSTLASLTDIRHSSSSKFPNSSNLERRRNHVQVGLRAKEKKNTMDSPQSHLKATD